VCGFVTKGVRFYDIIIKDNINNKKVIIITYRHPEADGESEAELSLDFTLLKIYPRSVIIICIGIPLCRFKIINPEEIPWQKGS
jgi:hypothetical protein